ncbi:unnamed protein product [Notodromas monacha]|uniref:CLIP domain-containing serine protease n=1 Tax=Notodromas monacha TaxID=399045 RepID=A0A7R9BYC6_9CRUS|nr:unnamed protein product [Notodromas monacha]CAG0922516.1 unnamed protein product [Notodromas monacha]
MLCIKNMMSELVKRVFLFSLCVSLFGVSEASARNERQDVVFASVTKREAFANSLGSCETPPRFPTTESGKPGECVPVTDCPDLLQFLKGPERDIGYLRRTICRLIGSTAYVCCPIPPPPPATLPPVEPLENGGFSSDPAATSRSLFPDPKKYECGGILSNRIVNGEDAPQGAWPWMALLFYEVQGGAIKHGCGGSLINSRAYVRLGEHDLRTNPDCDRFNDCSEYLDFEVEEIKVHPNFTQHPYKGAKNDIALIRLKSEAKVPQEKYKISPVCLPFNPLDADAQGDKALSSATGLFVTGWGRISVEFKNNGSNILQQLRVPIISATKCRETPAFRRVDFGAEHLCAGGEEGKDSCKGDSGGPLVIGGQKDDTSTSFFQVGVVSFGTPYCGLIQAPGVYTRVSTYLDWITDTVRA